MSTTKERISITQETEPVNVTFEGAVIASTKRALILRETGHAPVYYIPREDVAMEFLLPTAHTSHCPYKGDARYWSISAGGHAAPNAVWGYEHPKAGVEAIADCVAFYPDMVEIRVG
ncbi:DUF427 domain-containing protein [Mangrovibrevibacter kandeliae]|uniref:DUF427 domain-containing protein n=1 Tax=Mangrovibrevibacter kandeliae TaxID=2968473 RepID=UPI002118B4E1|nr:MULTISPECIES: DUF427 domain-containing protein [unclassified Aurantimonas]MCQ8783741.1 DUF427 domain-containing protein [Aurantimonas sp. CSK15Z-1]MCW4116296.1 DUF427 domain-containing protein [Aurantimonas sp. MSK8Z-1]